MKHIITESRLNQAIKQYIESYYDYVVSVSFYDVSVWLANEDRSKSRTIIRVIVDPYKILDGNISGSFKSYDKDIRRDIWNNLNKLFSLGFDKYGSDWDIEVFGIKLEVI